MAKRGHSERLFRVLREAELGETVVAICRTRALWSLRVAVRLAEPTSQGLANANRGI
jgi:hypothetical protein